MNNQEVNNQGVKWKKTILFLGTVITTIAPIATVVSCGNESKEVKHNPKSKDTKGDQKQTQKQAELIKKQTDEQKTLKAFKKFGEEWEKYDANQNFRLHANKVNDFKENKEGMSKFFTLKEVEYSKTEYAITDILDKKLYDQYKQIKTQTDFKVENYSLVKDSKKHSIIIKFDVVLYPKFLVDKTAQRFSIEKEIKGFAENDAIKQDAKDEFTLNKYKAEIKYWGGVEMQMPSYKGLYANNISISGSYNYDWYEVIDNFFDGIGTADEKKSYFLDDKNPETKVAFNKRGIKNNDLTKFVENFKYTFNVKEFNFDVFDELLKDKRFSIQNFRLLKGAYFDEASKFQSRDYVNRNESSIVFHEVIRKNGKSEKLIQKNGEGKSAGLMFKFNVKLGNVVKDLLVAVPLTIRKQ